MWNDQKQQQLDQLRRRELAGTLDAPGKQTLEQLLGELEGGWLDQPLVSRYYPGAVITVSIEPMIEFNGAVEHPPHTMNPGVAERIDVYRDRALGWKLSGAGGGGYLILVADRPIEHSVRVVVRRERE